MPKILVADDNSNVQKTVALALAGLGVEVASVNNGEAAVRKLADFMPDLVLADIFMPVRSGYEVCEYIKKDSRFSHMPVVLLVGAFDPLDEREAQRVGADGILKKPFVPPDPLITMVKTLLERNPAERMVAVPGHRAVTSPQAQSPTKAAAELKSTQPTPRANVELPHKELPVTAARTNFEDGERPIAFSQFLTDPAEVESASSEVLQPVVQPIGDEQILTSSRDATLGEPIFWRNDAPDTRSSAHRSTSESTVLDMAAWDQAEPTLPGRDQASLLPDTENFDAAIDDQRPADSGQITIEPLTPEVSPQVLPKTSLYEPALSEAGYGGTDSSQTPLADPGWSDPGVVEQRAETGDSGTAGALPLAVDASDAEVASRPGEELEAARRWQFNDEPPAREFHIEVPLALDTGSREPSKLTTEIAVGEAANVRASEASSHDVPIHSEEINNIMGSVAEVSANPESLVPATIAEGSAPASLSVAPDSHDWHDLIDMSAAIPSLQDANASEHAATETASGREQATDTESQHGATHSTVHDELPAPPALAFETSEQPNLQPTVKESSNSDAVGPPAHVNPAEAAARETSEAPDQQHASSAFLLEQPVPSPALLSLDDTSRIAKHDWSEMLEPAEAHEKTFSDHLATFDAHATSAAADASPEASGRVSNDASGDASGDASRDMSGVVPGTVPSDTVRDVATNISPLAASANPFDLSDPALVEAVVQRVLEKMRPQVVDIITREFLRPAVQALVHREIEKH